MLDNILQAIKDKLHGTEEENRKLRWIIEGMIRFSKLLSDQSVNKNTFYYELTGLMVRYVKAGYGNLYILNHPQGSHDIQIKAGHNYGLKKEDVSMPDTSKDGLLWKAVLQTATINTTDVPDGYTPVLIGVNSVPPKSVIILPLLLKGQLYGVMEIVSLRICEPYEIELLEKMAECIASAISSEQILDKTQKILLESQIKTTELLTTHTKIQQDIHELRAVQRQILSLQPVRIHNKGYLLCLN